MTTFFPVAKLQSAIGKTKNPGVIDAFLGISAAFKKRQVSPKRFDG